jgi:flagellar FliL protein
MSDDAKASPAKKKSKLKLLLMVVLILVLLGGGGAGAFWWMSRNGAEPAKGGEHAAAQTHEEEGHASAISLPTFTVNLADKDASRYLRTTLSLVINDADVAEELTGEHGGPNVKLMKARSAILELLSTQTAEQLSTPEGKEALKKGIAAKATKAFGTKVTDVLFAEFVVQF